MELDYFELGIQIAGIITAVIGGFGAVPTVNFLKNALNLKGNAALILTVVLSVIWGIAELLIGGQLTPDMLTIGNLAAVVATVFAISQAKYKMITQPS